MIHRMQLRSQDAPVLLQQGGALATKGRSTDDDTSPSSLVTDEEVERIFPQAMQQEIHEMITPESMASIEDDDMFSLLSNSSTIETFSDSSESDNDSSYSSSPPLDNESVATTSTSGSNNDDNDSDRQRVFTQDEVKNGVNGRLFFIAGRGGETNFYNGNRIFRDIIAAQHATAYAEAGPKGRGKKYARRLLREDEEMRRRRVTFVVRQAYFVKNLKCKNISTVRAQSVFREHLPSGGLPGILAEDPDSYLTIGEDWSVGIVTDLLRTAALGYGRHKKASRGYKRTAPPTATWNQPSVNSPVHAAHVNKRRRKMATEEQQPQIERPPAAKLPESIEIITIHNTELLNDGLQFDDLHEEEDLLDQLQELDQIMLGELD